MKISKKCKLVSSVVCFTFAVTTTGTLAHAKNVYQRSQTTKRLEEQGKGRLQVQQTMSQVQKILTKWDQVGSRVEEFFSDDKKVDQAFAFQFEKAKKDIEEMTSDQIADLTRQTRRLIVQTSREGNVAAAEQLEGALYSSPDGDFKSALVRFYANTAYARAKDRTLSAIEDAGGIKGYLEGSIQKLAMKDGFTLPFNLTLLGILVTTVLITGIVGGFALGMSVLMIGGPIALVIMVFGAAYAGELTSDRGGRRSLHPEVEPLHR